MKKDVFKLIELNKQDAFLIESNILIGKRFYKIKDCREKTWYKMVSEDYEKYIENKPHLNKKDKLEFYFYKPKFEKI